MRRLLPLTALFVLGIAGCGGDPGPTPGGPLTPAQQTARVKLVKTNQSLNDLDMAHLCPAIYPADVLDPSRAKHYGYDGKKVTVKAFTQAQLELAAAARCGKPVPLPAPAVKATKKTAK